MTVSFCIRINPFSLVLSKLRTVLLGSIFTFGLRRKQERESIRNLVFVDTADVEFSTVDFEIICILQGLQYLCDTFQVHFCLFCCLIFI